MVRLLIEDVTLTKQEEKGLKLFNNQGKCALCHLPDPALAPDGLSPLPPLFTDFTYDNLGVPKNPLNPATIADNQTSPLGLAIGFCNSTYGQTKTVGQFPVSGKTVPRTKCI